MGGTELGGTMTREPRMRASSTVGAKPDVSTGPRNPGRFIKTAVGAVGAGALLVGGVVAVDSWNRKNNRIGELEASALEQDKLLSTTIALGNAGVRFSDVSLNDGSVIVEIPGTSPNCQSISFDFDSTAEGWTLSLEQPDAAGRVYDQAEAHDAASVEMLVQDLCS